MLIICYSSSSPSIGSSFICKFAFHLESSLTELVYLSLLYYFDEKVEAHKDMNYSLCLGTQQSHGVDEEAMMVYLISTKLGNRSVGAILLVGLLEYCIGGYSSSW